MSRTWIGWAAGSIVAPGPISHQETFETTLGSASRLRLSLRQKLMRELHRAGGNIRKQLFLAKKRRQLAKNPGSREA